MEQGTKQQQRPQQQNHHQDNAVVVGDKHCMDPTNSAETRICFLYHERLKHVLLVPTTGPVPVQ